MKKYKKTIIIGLAVTAAYLLFTSSKKKQSSKGGDSASDDTGSARKGFPLRKGSTGRYVAALQEWLNNKQPLSGIDYVAVDSVFGEKTLAALNETWKALHGYGIREVNEVMYLSEGMNAYE